MAGVNVDFLLGRFPLDFCWQNPQQFADALIALLTGTIGGNFNGVIISQNTPQLTDQDKLWIKTDSNGRPVGQFLFLGTWLWPHPTPPSGNERRIWVSSETNLWSYDGGDGTDPVANPPTATTGAMWQRDTNFDFRIPVGAGTNGTAYEGNPASSIAVGDTGGEERHALTGNESVGLSHQHAIGQMAADPADAGQHTGVFETGTATPVITGTGRAIQGDAAGDVTKDFSTLTGADLVSGPVNDPPAAIVSHQNMPPWRGVLFIKRTSRSYYTAS